MCIRDRLDAVTGLGILSIVIWFQRRVENVVTHAIQAIGRRSLFIFCVHTAELTAIPWYLMPQKFAAHPVLGMVLHFTLSLGSTLLICELLVRRRDLKFWLTSRREMCIRDRICTASSTLMPSCSITSRRASR